VRRVERRNSRSRGLFCLRTSACFLAISAQRHTAKRADDADERSAIGTRVPFRGALLIPAKPANHGVPFAELLGHIVTFSRPEPREDGARSRSRESTSGSTFHNALRTLQPASHPVGTCLVPAIWHWREPSLLPLALEAEPAIAVLTCDGNRSSEWSAPPLGSATAVQFPDIRSVCGRARRGPAVDPPSLCRGRRDQPDFPPSARRVEERPITHRQVLRREWCAKVCAHHFIKHGGCQNRPMKASSHPGGKRMYMSVFGIQLGLAYRVSSFLPTSR
jgi:hypothetical protein